MPPGNNPFGFSQDQVLLRQALTALRDEMLDVAGTATKLAQEITQVLENGGTVKIDSKLHFLTGAHARAIKDSGKISHLTNDKKVMVKKIPRT